MTQSSLDEGDYREQQEHEEEQLAYIMEILNRIRAGTQTEQDIHYLHQELIRTQPNQETKSC